MDKVWRDTPRKVTWRCSVDKKPKNFSNFRQLQSLVDILKLSEAMDKVLWRDTPRKVSWSCSEGTWHGEIDHSQDTKLCSIIGFHILAMLSWTWWPPYAPFGNQGFSLYQSEDVFGQNSLVSLCDLITCICYCCCNTMNMTNILGHRKTLPEQGVHSISY